MERKIKPLSLHKITFKIVTKELAIIVKINLSNIHSLCGNSVIFGPEEADLDAAGIKWAACWARNSEILRKSDGPPPDKIS